MTKMRKQAITVGLLYVAWILICIVSIFAIWTDGASSGWTTAGMAGGTATMIFFAILPAALRYL